MSTRKGDTKMAELIAKRLVDVLPMKLTVAEKAAITSATKNIGHEFGEWLFTSRNEKDKEINHNLIYLREKDKEKAKVIKMSLEMGVSPDLLFAKTKGKMEVQTARHICVYRMIEQYGLEKMSYRRLGIMFGRDRASARHSFHTAKSLKNIQDSLFMHMYKLSKNVRL